jgi:hypothetical protein
MSLRRSLAGLLALACASCSTFDPKHPAVGKPKVTMEETAYWVWYADNGWHLRMIASSHAHRFQGSMAGVRGGVVDLLLTKPELKDGVAIGGDAVQFDVEVGAADGPQGFDAHVIGSCARFDLLVDGHKPDVVRMGPRGLPVRHQPFERCP